MSVLKSGGILISLILFFQIWIKFRNSKPSGNDDEQFNVKQFIRNFGYPIEIHQTISDDGYILSLHRIPHGRKPSNKTNRIPILFVHGLLNSAVDFIHLGPDKALGLLLADKNYDIWLANVRGNTWSRKHTKLDPVKDKEKFWDFNFHEVGVYDLPAMIDYILEQTNQTKLHYVGFSQGVIVYFIMASEKPEYVVKMRLMSAMGPAVYMSNTKGPINTFLGYQPYILRNAFHYLDIHEFFPNYGFTAQLAKNICYKDSLFVSLCLHQIFLVYGYDYEQLNLTLLENIFTNMPAGCSAKQFMHANQFMFSGRFAQYDFGTEENRIRYGQIEPPLYDLTKAIAPVAIYYGSNDWICPVPDAERLIENLPNVVQAYRVPYENFNHHDFLFAKDADKLLYQKMIEEIDKF